MVRLDAPPAARPGAPDFRTDGQDWPHRDHSEFRRIGAVTWHIQRMGDGPAALLLHGTGASTHSFMDLAALMAPKWRVISVDLPGHGFTQWPARMKPGQDEIAAALVQLLDGLDEVPSLVIGHSAGAAVMIALAELGTLADAHLVSLNGALTPFPGLAQILFPATAQLLTFGGVTAHLLAQSARSRGRVERLLGQTGGAPDDRYIDCYRTLLQSPAHISGTLRLMASWDLSTFESRLRRLNAPILFIAASQDQAVDPADADRLATLAPHARAIRLDWLGHLAHEQDAQRVWETIETALAG